MDNYFQILEKRKWGCMKINKINILLISIILIIGCSKEEEEEKSTEDTTNTAQSITTSDFSITNYSTYDNSSSSESGVVYQLNSDSSFYDNKPSSSSSSTNCAFFNALSTATFEKASNNTHILAINDMSVEDCFDSISGLTITYSKGSYYMYGVVIVDSSGVVDVTGKTMSNACTSCYIQQSAQAMYIELSGTSSSGDVKLIIKQLQSESDGGACNVTSLLNFSSDCYNQEYNSSVIGTSSEIALHKLIFKSGLDASSSGTYFTNGTITFQYNNWNGTMTYSSDNTSAAPNYSATNGTDNVSGTYNPSSSSSRSKRDNNLNTNFLGKQIISSFKNFVF